MKIRLHVIAALGAGIAIGGAAGFGIAAPTATDIRNACVANQVVPHAGVPHDITPGPRSSTVDTTPARP